MASEAPIDQWQRRSGAAVLIGVGVVLGALLGRLGQINATLQPRLDAVARQQQRSHTIIPARRGTIFDAGGRVIAASRQLRDVFVDPSLVGDLDALAAKLSVCLNLRPADLAKKIRSRPDSRFVVVARRVDEITAESVQGLGSPAVGLVDHGVRTYPLGSSMGQVLGFVGDDGHGLEGIELTYDAHLGGQDGRRATIRDARRRAFWRLEGYATPPIDGGHVVLTIDSQIQRIAEERLDEAMRRFEAKSGVAIVMSPGDGAILAMACQSRRLQPARTLAQAKARGSRPAQLGRNRAVTDPTEPGSTFKPFIVCGALDGGFVSSTELFDCHMGVFRFGRRLVHDSSPHGLLDIKGIITKSSNIGMGIVGHRMGNAALHETLLRFGFGSRTGIDCPGESAGLVYPLSRWTSYSTSSVPMGYEVGVTPVQLITAFCAIVNDGILLRPRLVKQLLGPQGNVVESFESPRIVRRAVSSSVARYMAHDLLANVVEEGTGRRARVGPYRVLGKTGTAKLPYTDRRGYEPGAYLGTFLASGPADDPEVAVLVMIRRPNAALGYYGGTVAAPAAGEILSETLSYLGAPTQGKLVCAGL